MAELQDLREFKVRAEQGAVKAYFTGAMQVLEGLGDHLDQGGGQAAPHRVGVVPAPIKEIAKAPNSRGEAHARDAWTVWGVVAGAEALPAGGVKCSKAACRLRKPKHSERASWACASVAGPLGLAVFW